VNDFCSRFYGVGGDSGPKVVPYTFEDVVKTLNAIQPYDWARFLQDRLDGTAAHEPLEGIDRSGYRLEYTEEMNDYIRASESSTGGVNAWYSLGLTMSSDTAIRDVLVDSPAYRAGLGPGMKIVAVNGLRTTEGTLRAAIRAAKTSKKPLEFIVENQDTFRVMPVVCHQGERYPHLARVTGEPDSLDEIFKPMTADAAPTKKTAMVRF
jgi:predicted metalloprotease with PDZ domain